MKNKAIERGLITPQEAEMMSDQQINDLILTSGFSTTEKVSDVSGRGVGLDVVKNTIESLGGNISIESEEGRGSTFSIQLPLTLSIISVLLVELQKEKYAILYRRSSKHDIEKSEIYKAHDNQVNIYHSTRRFKEIFEVRLGRIDDFVSIHRPKK